MLKYIRNLVFELIQLTLNTSSEGSLTNLGNFLVLVDPGAVGEVILVDVPLLVLGDAGRAGLVTAGALAVVAAVVTPGHPAHLNAETLRDPPQSSQF